MTSQAIPTQIVADIGGTNARFAFIHSGQTELCGLEIFSCTDYPIFLDAIRAYLALGHAKNFNKICLAVPGPVEFDQITLPNSHWSFSLHELEEALGVEIIILNDFGAQLLCIDALPQSDFQWIGNKRPRGNQVKAILGPGTGLGVSAMFPGGEILPTEGGHLAFAPVNQHEVDLLSLLWQRFERVSVERILSGPGLENLYWANSCLHGQENELSAEKITAGAYAGDKTCLLSVNDFIAILASVAGEIAITMGALDGVYLSGGIISKLDGFIQPDEIRARFNAKGRFENYCSNIPLAIILAEHPGLIGCVQCLMNVPSEHKPCP